MTLYLSVLLADSLRYLIPAGITWILLTVVFNHWATPRRLGPLPNSRQIRREVALSGLTALIFALNGVAINALNQCDIIMIYNEVRQLGTPYLLLSLILVLTMHELYFYFIHRMLHLPWLFRHVHRWHHRSVHPTPWAAYAFHPVEAVLMALFLPLVLLILPLHSGVIIVFLLFMIIRNVTGHCGVELATNGPVGRLYTRLMTTTTHHHQHHQFARGNYGLYFRFTDQLLGTERDDYTAAISRYSSRTNTTTLGDGL